LCGSSTVNSKLPQGLQLSPCVTTNTVEMEFMVRWCGDEKGEETCVLLFDLGSVMAVCSCVCCDETRDSKTLELHPLAEIHQSSTDSLRQNPLRFFLGVATWYPKEALP
jgi:hypothetical protein